MGGGGQSLELPESLILRKEFSTILNKYSKYLPIFKFYIEIKIYQFISNILTIPVNIP